MGDPAWAIPKEPGKTRMARVASVATHLMSRVRYPGGHRARGPSPSSLGPDRIASSPPFRLLYCWTSPDGGEPRATGPRRPGSTLEVHADLPPLHPGSPTVLRRGRARAEPTPRKLSPTRLMRVWKPALSDYPPARPWRRHILGAGNCQRACSLQEGQRVSSTSRSRCLEFRRGRRESHPVRIAKSEGRDLGRQPSSPTTARACLSAKGGPASRPLTN